MTMRLCLLKRTSLNWSVAAMVNWLRRIRSCRRALTQSAAITLVNSFIVAPSYITKLCVPVASIRPRSSLRSAARGTLFVPRTRLELGKRAFAVATPAAWNSLPGDVRSAPTLLTNLNNAWKWKPILLFSHITHSLVLVELSRTTFPLCL